MIIAGEMLSVYGSHPINELLSNSISNWMVLSSVPVKACTNSCTRVPANDCKFFSWLRYMTANRIKEVALTHFAKDGYEGSSLSAIATEVGIKTIHLYSFQRKR